MLLYFKCLHCIHCCYFSSRSEGPTLFPWEKRLLEEVAEKTKGVAKRLSFSIVEVFRKEEACAIVLYRLDVSGFCPFFDITTKKCSIHSVKPLACKLFPLLLDLSEGRIAISGKCKWVEENSKNLKEAIAKHGEKLLKIIFAREYSVASEVINVYNFLVSTLLEKGFRRETDKSRCSRYIDADKLLTPRGQIS